MIHAVVERGAIRLTEPLPADWVDGQSLQIEKLDEPEMTPEKIIRDFAILESLCAAGDPEDDERLERALRRRTASRRIRFAGKWGFPDADLLARLQSPFRGKSRTVAAAGGDSLAASTRRAICDVHSSFVRVGSRHPTDGEPDEFRQRLVQLRQHFRIWPLDLDTSSRYGDIYRELHQKGRTLSQVDMMLAALARQYRLTILTSDRDFEALPDIRAENWIA